MFMNGCYDNNSSCEFRYVNKDLEKMELFILGICREIFFFFFSEKRGKKLGSVLYTGAHYTRVNTVHTYIYI